MWFLGNRLHNIPVEISSLRCLRSLDISNNKISVLPEELCEVQTLESIMVDVAQMHHPSSGSRLLLIVYILIQILLILFEYCILHVIYMTKTHT